MSLLDLPDVPSPTPDDPVEEYLTYLGLLLEDAEEVGYAVATLEGIRDTIQKRWWVTPGQREAVRNIVLGGERYLSRSHHRSGSRRYEGFGRRA